MVLDILYAIITFCGLLLCLLCLIVALVLIRLDILSKNNSSSDDEK